MKTIICNNYDSCVHASIYIMHENGEVWEVDPREFFDKKHCNIDILKVGIDAINHIGKDFKLLNFIDGYLIGSFEGKDLADLKLKIIKEGH